ncbi:MAG: hypothetical protein ACRDD1_22055, partial [Planctomycetia bacterium]
MSTTAAEPTEKSANGAAPAVPATPATMFTDGMKKNLEIDKLFRLCMKMGGSDLHLKTGKPPMIRHKGSIRQLEMPPLT